MSQILAGAKAPERLEISIANSAGATQPLDLTTVTAVALLVTRPDGSRVAWYATVLTQAADTLVLEHVFDADGAETEQPGVYHLLAEMTVPAGVRRAGPTAFSAVTFGL